MPDPSEHPASQPAPAVPVSAVTSALVATLVGFGGTVVICVHAVQAAGGAPVHVISAITALCLGQAIAGAALSFALRMPVVLAWSTPGAALIGASAIPAGWPAAVGAFAFSALLMMLVGLVPALGRLAARIPSSVAAAMLAGVLLPFCLGLFRTFQSDLPMAALLLVVFLMVRQRLPIYAMLAVLAVAVAVLLLRGDVSGFEASSMFGTLSWTTPAFDPRLLVSLGLPLFLVTMMSQNLPGLVVLRTAGYQPPPGPLLLATGFTSLVLAPFGAFSVNLAAITAAICTGPDAHPDRDRRWIVGVFYAGFYLVLAAFCALVLELFLAMPPQALAVIAGIALLGPLTGALTAMVEEADHREAAILTFAATASGLTLFGIGSAFWGLVAGFAALGARHLFRRR